MAGIKDGIRSSSLVDFFEERFPTLKNYDWEVRYKLLKILNDIYLDGGGIWD